MRIRILLAAGTSLALAGCATGGVEGKGDNRTIAASAAQQAAKQHPAIVQEFGGAEQGARAAYVADVGRSIAAQSGIQGGGTGVYTFTVLNSPVLNAFAVPGGHVYITRQLLGLMNDEAELASVLGHEVGHIAADHQKGRQDRGLLSQLGAVLIGAVTGSSQLAELAGKVSQGLFLGYSREQEYEADELGIRYMAAAGYDPLASASLLASLGAATSLDARAQGRDDQRAVPSWARTHPLSEDRVRRAASEARETGAATRGIRDRNEFLAMIDGLMVDDDPRQGVVEGRHFLHPDLRLRFSVPDGYGIQNGTRAVSIVGQSGQAQFSGGAYSGDLGAYIARVFRALGGDQMQIPYSEPRATSINGIPAAYSTARITTQQGQLDLTVFAYRWDGDTAYHFALLTPAGSGLGPFAPMVQSLGRLSASEAAAIRPRVIDVLTVALNDRVEDMAERMAYPDHREERFRVLNGLSPTDRLVPGQKVKVVVYGTR